MQKNRHESGITTISREASRRIQGGRLSLLKPMHRIGFKPGIGGTIEDEGPLGNNGGKGDNGVQGGSLP